MFPVWNNKKHGQQGYTLLELLTVLAIVSLILTAIPALNSRLLPNVIFLEVKNQLLHDIRALKSQAQQSGKPQKLLINKTLDGYQVGENGVKRRFDNYQLDSKGTLLFFPNGTGSYGQVSIYNEAYKATIEIDHITGAIIKREGYEG